MSDRIMTAMSGGVDSSAAAYILKNDGYDTAGMTLRLYVRAGDTSETDAADAAKGLGIPHFILDLTDEFAEHVIRPFCESYLAGETPNPCVLCNRRIKFDAFAASAARLGYPKMATGHYARTEYDSGSRRWLLKKAAYIPKDQSYVLYTLTQEMLSRTLFPLGSMTKEEARDVTRQAGLSVADRAESQDICFVPDGDYEAFIESFMGTKAPCGNFVDLSGNVLGRHTGLTGYTIGQRRGMGVAADRRLYVIDKRVGDNTVVLGDNSDLYSRRVPVGDINLIAVSSLTAPVRVEAKLRYSQRTAPALLTPTSETGAVLEFDEPQRAAARGQSAVFYDGEYVIGGGVIV